ncbi:MAG: hypothetical protein LBT01_02395 [Spirochaetaceae bacterium]|jgi:hypothetical protein|nr:hypothetical protein [Spirochaetaceae bacterium]
MNKNQFFTGLSVMVLAIGFVVMGCDDGAGPSPAQQLADALGANVSVTSDNVVTATGTVTIAAGGVTIPANVKLIQGANQLVLTGNLIVSGVLDLKNTTTVSGAGTITTSTGASAGSIVYGLLDNVAAPGGVSSASLIANLDLLDTVSGNWEIAAMTIDPATVTLTGANTSVAIQDGSTADIVLATGVTFATSTFTDGTATYILSVGAENKASLQSDITSGDTSACNKLAIGTLELGGLLVPADELLINITNTY